MRLRFALPGQAVTQPVLDAALEVSTRANEALYREGAPSLMSAIKRRKVRYRPEPYRDGEHLDLAPLVVQRGWGDCDDLAPGVAGELRVSGIDPGAVAIARRSGPSRWHAVVQTSDGRILDPSKWAGMGQPQISGLSIQRPIVMPGEGGIAIKRARGRWCARCDIPLDDDAHVSGIAADETPEAAASRAVVRALSAREGDPIARRRAKMLRACMSGLELDDDDAMGFLPIAAALAPTAIDMAKGMFSKKKKGGAVAPAGAPMPERQISAVPPAGGPVTVTPYSSGGSAPGPIIVRF